MKNILNILLILGFIVIVITIDGASVLWLAIETAIFILLTVFRIYHKNLDNFLNNAE